MQFLSNYYSGLSGLQLPLPRYKYPAAYQNTSRLTYYSTFFNSIEVNSSFYKIPMNATVARWSSSVHDHFSFTFKLFREITHIKNLNFERSHIDNFIQTISHADVKKGCLLVQFPPGLKKENIHHLDNLLHCISMADPDNQWKVAIEFRDKGWYNEEVYGLLETHRSALVIHDIPASATPFANLLSEFIYVRFHGPTGNYSGSYSDAFLIEYSGYIKEWLAEGKKVFVYFNNTKGDAFNNLVTLNRFLL
jgi:uncharacterized protein YecE (DUF72 family)